MPRALLLAVLGVLAGGSALAAVALGAQGETVVPGGMAGADLVAPDPDLQMVVGLAQGPRFLGLGLGPAPERVLAVPDDAPAELGALVPTGERFAFTDPHGNAWDVEEYRAAWGYAYGTNVGPDTQDPDAGRYNFVLLVDPTKVGEHLRLVAA